MMSHSPSRRHVKGYKQEPWERRIVQRQSNEKPSGIFEMKIKINQKGCRLGVEIRVSESLNGKNAS